MNDFCVANYANNYRLQDAMKKSYEDFGQRKSLSYKEYGELKGIDEYEAGSYDLNENQKIDLFEDAAASCAKEDLETTAPPIMFVRYIADMMKLPDMQNSFLNTLEKAPAEYECENCGHINTVA